MTAAVVPNANPADAMQRLQGIASRIQTLRGQRVMLSPDLAQLYGIETRVLMQAVRRNIERFPDDFQFVPTPQELAALTSQFVISSWGGTRKPPMAFTEQGVAMLSSVLRSPQAVAVNIEIMRAFVRLRGMLSEHAALKRQIEQLEKRYDAQFRQVFDAIRALMAPPDPPKKHPMGFMPSP